MGSHQRLKCTSDDGSNTALTRSCPDWLPTLGE